MLPRIHDNKDTLAAKDKFNNATSTAISELLLDVDSIRYAMLQNRAATDFLLSAHRHGCQDFKGLCCMNLSDHSKSIHAQLQERHRPNQQLVETTGCNLFWMDLGVGLVEANYTRLPVWKEFVCYV